jgi:hypothetical protein
MKKKTYAQLVKELAAAKKEHKEDVNALRAWLNRYKETEERLAAEQVGFEKWRNRAHDAEIMLIRTYNILSGYNTEACTPINEVMGLILTAASVNRKRLVELELKQAKSTKK